jgi:hypothetical protein
MRQQHAAPAVPGHPGHQHDTGLWPRPCCELWPPAGRVRTIGNVLTTGRLLQGVIYAARLLATLVAVAAVHTLLLPATTAWAGTHGYTGWTLWTLWAGGTLAALYHGVLARRRSRTAVHLLHALTVNGVLLAIAAPGGWAQALTATIGATAAWLTAMHATHRWHRQPPL